MSLKKTKNADNIIPTPILNINRQTIGYKRSRKRKLILMPSAITNTKKIIKDRPKLIKTEIFLDNKKMYLGALILVITFAFAIKACMPPLVDSLKKLYTSSPANR